MLRRLFLGVLFGVGLIPTPLLAQSPNVPATKASVVISGTVAGPTKIVSGIAGQSIYVTSLALTPLATSLVTLTAGTGTNCGTSTVTLAVYGGADSTSDLAFGLGSGWGAVLVVPKGSDLCITIATARSPGSLSYDQF